MIGLKGVKYFFRRFEFSRVNELCMPLELISEGEIKGKGKKEHVKFALIAKLRHDWKKCKTEDGLLQGKHAVYMAYINGFNNWLNWILYLK